MLCSDNIEDLRQFGFSITENYKYLFTTLYHDEKFGYIHHGTVQESNMHDPIGYSVVIPQIRLTVFPYLIMSSAALNHITKQIAVVKELQHLKESFVVELDTMSHTAIQMLVEMHPTINQYLRMGHPKFPTNGDKL